MAFTHQNTLFYVIIQVADRFGTVATRKGHINATCDKAMVGQITLKSAQALFVGKHVSVLLFRTLQGHLLLHAILQ